MVIKASQTQNMLEEFVLQQLVPQYSLDYRGQANSGTNAADLI